AADFPIGGCADAGHDQGQRSAAIGVQGQARIVPGGDQLAAQIEDRRAALAGQATRLGGMLAGKSRGDWVDHPFAVVSRVSIKPRHSLLLLLWSVTENESGPLLAGRPFSLTVGGNSSLRPMCALASL